MDTHTHKAIEGGQAAPLDRRQKTVLVMAARRAYDLQEKWGLTGGAAFEAWRHAQQYAACGEASLCGARQRHYRPLLAHWQMLQGAFGPARRSREMAATDPERQARHMLEREIERAAAAGVFADAAAARGYAAGFLRNKRGVGIATATARDLWHAVFLLRRKVSLERRRRQGRVNAPGGASGATLVLTRGGDQERIAGNRGGCKWQSARMAAGAERCGAGKGVQNG